MFRKFFEKQRQLYDGACHELEKSLEKHEEALDRLANLDVEIEEERKKRQRNGIKVKSLDEKELKELRRKMKKLK